jgi:hypothetical protein
MRGDPPAILLGNIRQLPELQVTSAVFTLDAHVENLRDEAYPRGQLSPAIQAEVKRGELRVSSMSSRLKAAMGDFSRMSDDEPREYIAEQDMILARILAGPVLRLAFHAPWLKESSPVSDPGAI